MSFVNTSRNSSPPGDIRSPSNSGAYSGTSAHAVPRPSAHMCSDAIRVHTSPSLITPAVRVTAPSASQRARDKWLAGQARHLLPVPYCHVVFTLPHELSPIALQNPKLMYDLLFRSVRDALLTIAADPKRLGAHLGFLCVLHTWDQKMLHHAHLHCLVPAGGLSLDRSRWIPCRKRFFLPVRVLGSQVSEPVLESIGTLLPPGETPIGRQTFRSQPSCSFRSPI